MGKHNADKKGKQGHHSNSPAVSDRHGVDSGDDGEVIVLGGNQMVVIG